MLFAPTEMTGMSVGAAVSSSLQLVPAASSNSNGSKVLCEWKFFIKRID